MRIARAVPLFLPALAALAVLAVSGSARAQNNVANVAQAEKLFDEAKALLEAGRTADACARFAESEKLDPQLGTLLNLALCNEQVGRTATAWAEFNDVVSLATRAGQTKRIELAKKHALSLEESLSRVKVDVSRAPAGVILQLDGESIAVVTGLRVPLDPGGHMLVASAPGRTPATVRFDVPRGPADTTVTVPALSPVVAPPPPPPPPPPGDVRAPVGAGPVPWETVGFVTGGVGALGLAFGLAAGGVALSKSNAASAGCPATACDTTAGYDANQSAHDWATVSTVSVVAGAGLVALGAVMIFVLPEHGPRRAAALDGSPLRLRF